MPHPVFGVDELLSLVIDELVETSPPAVVSFALTCRSFEEPALRSLWKLHVTLDILMRVLPNHTWVKNEHGIKVLVSGCSFSPDRIRTDFPRQSSAILRRRTGPGCCDTLLGSVTCTSVPTKTLPLIPFNDFQIIHPVGYCAPGWKNYTGTSVEWTPPYPSSAFSSPPI